MTRKTKLADGVQSALGVGSPAMQTAIAHVIRDCGRAQQSLRELATLACSSLAAMQECIAAMAKDGPLYPYARSVRTAIRTWESAERKRIAGAGGDPAVECGKCKAALVYVDRAYKAIPREALGKNAAGRKKGTASTPKAATATATMTTDAAVTIAHLRIELKAAQSLLADRTRECATWRAEAIRLGSKCTDPNRLPVVAARKVAAAGVLNERDRAQVARK